MHYAVNGWTSYNIKIIVIIVIFIALKPVGLIFFWIKTCDDQKFE